MIDQNSYSHRSLLFVPASRPECFEKAMKAGADTVCIDLEDAVPFEQKDIAREEARSFFGQDGVRTTRRALRVNSSRSVEGIKDILMLAMMKFLPDIILLPKVESPDELCQLNKILMECHDSISFMALIETPVGLEQATKIAKVKNVDCLVFGSADYSSQLGSQVDWDALLYARCRISQAAAVAGIEALDGAWMDLDDPDGLLRDSQRVAALGFSGRAALHPKQVAIINQAFMPSPEALLEAKTIIAAYQENKDGALLVDGHFVDPPVVERAFRTLGKVHD